MNITKEIENIIKEEFEAWCDGDNNHESFLDAQYADWVTVKLDYSTVQFDDDYSSATVEGTIDRVQVFKNDSGTWVSEWGDAHEFLDKDIKEEDGECYLENVRGEWTFSIEVKENEYSWNGYEITFRETDATENYKKTYRKRVKTQWAGEGDIVQKNMTEEAVKADFARRGYVSSNVYYECEQNDRHIEIGYLESDQEWFFQEITE